MAPPNFSSPSNRRESHERSTSKAMHRHTLWSHHNADKLSQEARTMEYFSWSRPAADGRCSDRDCPCPPPGTPIRRGTGYLFVENVGNNWRATLMCKMGAAKRHIDLQTAAADAKAWWDAGQVPCRQTPHSRSRATTSQPGLLSRLFSLFGRKTNCGHELAIHKCARCHVMFCAECLSRHAPRIKRISERTMGTVLRSVAASVSGSVDVFDRTGKAWCPRCVRSARQMKQIRRTVTMGDSD